MSYINKIRINNMITTMIASSHSKREAMGKINDYLSRSFEYYVNTRGIDENSYNFNYMKNELIPMIESIAEDRISKAFAI